MKLTVTLADQPSNTYYAPLAVLLWLYRSTQRLAPLENVQIAMQTGTFTPADKLVQLLISILAGCRYVCEVNTRLRVEAALAQVWPWPGYVEQSGLQKALDRLSQMNLVELRAATAAIWRKQSATLTHDWRAYLCLDLDLSGMPCGAQAEGSTKGYFSGKKTRGDANWPASAPHGTARPCGPASIPAIATAPSA